MPTCSDARLSLEQLPRFALYLRSLGICAARQRAYRLRARTFLLHRPDLPIKPRLRSWIQETVATAPSHDAARDRIRELSRFLGFCGVDELHQLLAPLRSCLHLVRALAAGLEWDQALDKVLGASPRFESGLAGWLQALLEHRASLRMTLRGWRCELLRLDRLALAADAKTPEELTPAVLERFLSQNRPSPGTRRCRLSTLRVLQRFLEPRGGRLHLPPGLSGHRPSTFRPHVFSLLEIGSILRRMRQCADRRHGFSWLGLETIIFLCYACGLRLGEPVILRLQDVDLMQATLLVHRTKFYKQRMLPLGAEAARRLAAYRQARDTRHPLRQAPEEPFFLTEKGHRFSRTMVRRAFTKVLADLEVVCRGTRPRPRLHDLRHTMAVHRLYQWYAQGADVQNKLPLLAAFLGHDDFHHTEVYLHLTEDLVRQAGRSFERSFETVVGRLVP